MFFLFNSVAIKKHFFFIKRPKKERIANEEKKDKSFKHFYLGARRNVHFLKQALSPPER